VSEMFRKKEKIKSFSGKRFNNKATAFTLSLRFQFSFDAGRREKTRNPATLRPCVENSCSENKHLAFSNAERLREVF